MAKKRNKRPATQAKTQKGKDTSSLTEALQRAAKERDGIISSSSKQVSCDNCFCKRGSVYCKECEDFSVWIHKDNPVHWAVVESEQYYRNEYHLYRAYVDEIGEKVRNLEEELSWAKREDR